MMKGESSPSTLTPLQMWRPEETKDSHHDMEMAIVPSSSTAIATTTAMIPSSRFTVPDDWIVEDRRRTSGKTAGVVDRYYYEPETGLKFRSLISIQRYLADSEEKTPLLKMLGFGKKEKLIHKRKLAILARSTTTRTSSLKLPDGWVVEECTRSSGYSAGRVDKYYHDPDTGLKFRSLRSVERYLAESNEKTPALKMLGFEKKELLRKRRTANATKATTIRTSSLKLPKGWVVEECVRTSAGYAGMVDKYYIEPGTGRKFRSLISAERHLAEVVRSPPTPKESKPGNRIMLLRADRQEVHQKSDIAGVAHAVSTYRTSKFQLPVDQIVKEAPSSSPNYDDVMDEYYREAGTGRQFRSLKAVERCLNEGREKPPTPKALKSGNSVMRTQNSGSRKKKGSNLKEKTPSFNSSKPPVKIKWVLSGQERDTWSPFVGESMVPDSVKQQWAKRFILSVDYRNFDA